ncbi:MAG: hypothetical protein HQM08_29070 [Candidatus Riflebacteria bacterium]|nr:hypothetical protein [Candidatus Riflebacteria bacterium]
MAKFFCPYLKGEVELTDERAQHISERHPELLPENLNKLVETLAKPEEIRRSARFQNAKLFTRWFSDLMGGKYVVAVVVTNSGIPKQHWVVTAYVARKLAEGEIEWKKN